MKSRVFPFAVASCLLMTFVVPRLVVAELASSSRPPHSFRMNDLALKSDLGFAQAELLPLPQDTKSTQPPPSPQFPDKTKISLGQIPGAEVHLDRTIYVPGSALSATVLVGSEFLSEKNPRLIVVTPESKDVEVVSLKSAPDAGGFRTELPLPVESSASSPAVQLDGRLSGGPNEIIVALFNLNNAAAKDASEEGMLVVDVGVMEDKNSEIAPVKLKPEIAMTPDEKQVPPGGKRIGTLASSEGGAVQIPLDELIIYPNDEQQLKQFLQEAQGTILMKSPALDQKKEGSYLVRVSTDKAEVEHLPQLRALSGEKGALYGSSLEVLRIFALAMQYRLHGWQVGVNPRLQFMNAPSTRDGAPFVFPNGAAAPIIDGMARNATSLSGPLPCALDSSSNACAFALDLFGVREAWAYLALWDRDNSRIPVAVLDQGFAPNFDFRGFSNTAPDHGIFQVDLDGGTGGPDPAAAPPTVGNSVTGAGSWHGTGVVTTLGGVLNNGWGSVGTGGQVVIPKLYRVGLRSYAFEMGLGMRRATDEGATIINISAGYPCRIVANSGADFGICTPLERAEFCQAVGLAASLAVLQACAVVPGFACLAALTVGGAAVVACNLAISLGDVRGAMIDGTDYAIRNGVTVVSIAGNQQSPSSLGVLGTIIATGTQDVARWDVIPGVLPGVVCAGAADDTPPFRNNQFFGARVDAWAPINEIYFHPPTITAVTGPNLQVRGRGDPVSGDPAGRDRFGGTSAAAPYISGIIAMMQAVNPNLDPRTTTLPLNTIPGIIRDIIRETATPASGIPILASDATDPEVMNRRNMVNAIAAVRAANSGRVGTRTFPIGLIPNFALGYDNGLGFDEAIDPATRADDPDSGRVFGPGLEASYTGTILALAPDAGPGGIQFGDIDYLNLVMPTAPGLYRRVVQLTQPQRARFGALLINGRAGRLVSRSTDGLEETWEYEYTEVDHRSVYAGISGSGLGSDNVYTVHVFPAQRIGERPMPDRFDQGFTPNNDRQHAVPLGRPGQLGWQAVPAGDPFTEGNLEITVPGLSFHTGSDRDWFEVAAPPEGVPISCDVCSPTLTISAGPAVTIEVYGADNRLLARGQTSVDLRCRDYRGNFPLRFVLIPTSGAVGNYDLHLSWNAATVQFCEALQRMNAMDHSTMAMNGFRMITMGDPLIEKIIRDDVGRIIQPRLYEIQWRGDEVFRLQGEVRQGRSIALQLLNLKGEPIAQAATADLQRQFKSSSPTLDSNETSILMIEIPKLAPGIYLLAISHGLPDTSVEITLPKNATTDGSTVVEEILKARSGKTF